MQSNTAVPMVDNKKVQLHLEYLKRLFICVSFIITHHCPIEEARFLINSLFMSFLGSLRKIEPTGYKKFCNEFKEFNDRLANIDNKEDYESFALRFMVFMDDCFGNRVLVEECVEN